jgi:hypothetical protein
MKISQMMRCMMSNNSLKGKIKIKEVKQLIKKGKSPRVPTNKESTQFFILYMKYL